MITRTGARETVRAEKLRGVFDGRTSTSSAAASCSSPGRTGRARRRCSALSPGSSSRPPASSRSTRRASSVGFLGHEPLVYRELTALENLDLYGRLYRVPERRERIGMLLERFGLWDARNERADSYSRGMLQRLALCRGAAARSRRCSCSTSRSPRSTRRARRCSTASSPSCASATFLVATHDPARVAPLATGRLAFA